MRRLDLTDPNPPRNAKPEQVKLLIAHRVGDTWGEFEPLRGTTWAAGIEEIPAEALAHALHGHLQPLLRVLGRSPHASGKLVSDEEGQCSLSDACPLYNKQLCRPGGKKGRELGPVDCYEPPVSKGTPSQIALLLREIAVAWKEGRHTIVVGDGFNLL